MNISLRQVKIDPSQTMFITSTGTVLFTCYTRCDPYVGRSTTVVTSINDLGSIVEIGLIKWNQNAGDSPNLCVGKRSIELRTIWREDAISTVFRSSDGQIYRWRTSNGVIILAADSVSSSPIAVAYDDVDSSSAIDLTDASVVLCIRPTGFHLLHETVATFILFEQLCEMIHAPSGRTSPRKGRLYSMKDKSSACADHVPPTTMHECTGRHVPWLRTRYFTHFTADLSGMLLRRHKYPSAYGGFSDIWKCDWLKDSRVIEVAVKVMRSNLTGGAAETEIKRISRELKVWVRLEHECVLPLYGISFDFGKFPAMVCPWLEGGTLSKYLEHHEGLHLHTRLRLLSDIADGLHYLHGCGIIHGDLTGSNVLIKDNGRACLSDFGLSRVFMETTGSSYLTSTVRGNVRWAAPELLEIEGEKQEETAHALSNPQTDIYSFGSIMLQVLTGKVPYHYYKNDAQVLFALYRGLRPARPVEPTIDDVLWEFMQRCWVSRNRRASGNVRPSIGETVDFLSDAIGRNQG